MARIGKKEPGEIVEATVAWPPTISAKQAHLVSLQAQDSAGKQ
jgi:hypothetical protein